MKKYLLLLLPLILSACSSMQPLQKETFYYSYDFRPYTEKGFLFTPLRYDGKYDSIGMLVTETYPELKQGENKSALGNIGWVQGIVFAYEAIDSMYIHAKNMGADAIINFTLSPVYRKVENNILNGIAVSGFAIKRK